MSINQNSQKSNGWDNTAEVLANFLNPKNTTIGFSTLFAIDALNQTIENVDKEMTILDIAAGTGVLSLYGTTKYKNAKFIATDFSAKMIQVLDKFIKELSLENQIESKVMDGQNLKEIQDNSIDYTYSIFGLIFFPDTLKGMKEMYRVLKANNQSKTAIGTWCNDAFLIQSFQLTMNQLLGNESYKQVAMSLSDSNVFESQLKEAGFKNIKITKVMHPMEIQEYTDLIKMFSVNPVYFDCMEALSNSPNYQQKSIDEIKQLFDETFLKIVNQLHDKQRNENGKFELKSYAYIGIGEK